MKIKSLSVFFPAYNEEGNIKNTVIKSKAVLLKYVENWEIIIVNDGSTDNTKKISEELSSEDKRIRVINHEVNRGYGASLKSGFYNAKYPWIIFTDSDGQFDIRELGTFLKEIENYDFVIGFRKKRQDPFHRKCIAFFLFSCERL